MFCAQAPQVGKYIITLHIFANGSENHTKIPKHTRKKKGHPHVAQSIGLDAIDWNLI